MSVESFAEIHFYMMIVECERDELGVTVDGWMFDEGRANESPDRLESLDDHTVVADQREAAELLRVNLEVADRGTALAFRRLNGGFYVGWYAKAETFIRT